MIAGVSDLAAGIAIRVEWRAPIDASNIECCQQWSSADFDYSASDNREVMPCGTLTCLMQ
jgi:hypothetical protein